MKTRNLFLLFILTLVFSGCSITENVKPVAMLETNKICIILDEKVREGFLETYRSTLQERGYTVRLLDPGSSYDTCTITSTYLGRWSWDLAIYMSYAEINVYRNGKLIGNALYDSTSASMSGSKFIKGEEKVKELVAKVFPVWKEGAAIHAAATDTVSATPASQQGKSGITAVGGPLHQKVSNDRVSVTVSDSLTDSEKRHSIYQYKMANKIIKYISSLLDKYKVAKDTKFNVSIKYYRFRSPGTAVTVFSGQDHVHSDVTITRADGTAKTYEIKSAAASGGGYSQDMRARDLARKHATMIVNKVVKNMEEMEEYNSVRF